MFHSKPPLRPDRSEPLDPVQAKLERRVLFAPPGHLGPFPTYDEVRTELDGLAARGAASARALTLSRAGFGPPIRVVVVRDLDGGIDRIERARTAIQPPPQSAEAEDFQPLGGAENAENPKKQESYGLEVPYPIDKASNRREPATEDAENDTYYVTVPLKISADPGRQRAHKNDVDWWDKKRVQAHKVSKTLSAKKRALVDDALLRLKVLKGKGVLVCVTMKPSHLDALGPVERMEYWEPLVNRFRSYRKRRCEILKRRLSSWEVWSVWVRESNPDTHLGEHCHWVVWMPDREEAEHFIAHVQDPSNSKTWGDNVQAMRISATEKMVGGKRSSFFNYMLKAAHPRSRFADHTIGWQASGALVGERFFITENLTSPEVIEETAAGVARLKEVREEMRLAASRRRAREEAKEGRLYRYDAAPSPAAVEPEPIEPAVCPTPGSAGPVHRDKVGDPEMDIVEVEIRPAVSAPAPILRELDIPAVIEPAVPAEVAAPLLPASAAITPAVGPATATPDDPIPAATVPPAPAAMTEPGPVSSSRKAPRLVSLAVLGRSVARGVVAGAGWITARLGVRAPPHPATAPPAGQPRAPLVHPSTIPAAGAFFGAPMLW